jgi:hypothetical protein
MQGNLWEEGYGRWPERGNENIETQIELGDKNVMMPSTQCCGKDFSCALRTYLCVRLIREPGEYVMAHTHHIKQ